MKHKLITKKDIRGIKYTPDIENLLLTINRKGTIFGWYFSSWWFDMRHSKEEETAMSAIIWQLVLNNVERFGFWFNDKTEAQLDLHKTATFIGDKLNGVWSETIVRWFRGMKYQGWDMDVNDQCGLNTLYVKVK